MRHRLFSLAVTVISRILIARDHMFGRVPQALSDEASATVRSRHSLASGSNLLDAVLVQPTERPAQAAILICHGIGETVDHWLPVQQMLAASQVASLVFDYSGYGRSSGSVDTRQCELDSVAAFHLLQALVPAVPSSVLGFSLGSGIAAAVIHKLPARKLFLCAAFTSLREAAISIGFPRPLSFLVAPLWCARDCLQHCATPIVILHGERDELFPVEMAIAIAGINPSRSELLLIPGLAHNQPFYNPHSAYWNLIISRLIS